MKIFISGLEIDGSQAKLANTQKHLTENGFTPVILFKYETDQVLWQSQIVSLIKECDAIYLFSNWIFSKRARIEKCIAEEYGKQVIFEDKTINDDPKIDQIKKVIENVTGLLYKDFITPCRSRNRYFARMLFVHHCLEFCSVRHVAKMINRDHTSLTRYIKEFDNEMMYNKQFRELAIKTGAILQKMNDILEEKPDFSDSIKKE